MRRKVDSGHPVYRNRLQHYQYRTGLSWWIFAAAGAGAILITLLTVSYQSIRAALANPVKSLRTE
jgi:putative ABC transport system permease protein